MGADDETQGQQQPVFDHAQLESVPSTVGRRLVHDRVGVSGRVRVVPRVRHVSNALPPPLALSRHTTASVASSGSNHMSSTTSMARSSEEGFDTELSAHRFISSSQSAVVDMWRDAGYEAPAPPPKG
ncbi:hypothetical protein MVEN_00786900 [Mycena venus]|uniref:Uncharacterized protein n=1 Tax=Mycena venus TaxID=2733690 RepID=A0A8H6YG41_9AGAR|nr:hypothetical protein MVEN_00786900 [Mycena venus]